MVNGVISHTGFIIILNKHALFILISGGFMNSVDVGFVCVCDSPTKTPLN